MQSPSSLVAGLPGPSTFAAAYASLGPSSSAPYTVERDAGVHDGVDGDGAAGEGENDAPLVVGVGATHGLHGVGGSSGASGLETRSLVDFPADADGVEVWG